MMFPMKMMTPSKPSKQTSAMASKIKNKILNTSSFFKVSLKNNNKALALALQAQKEKSRQLEMEVVYLQKQVEALCFELATKKYKQRKLLLILKNLHSNTLQHLNMAAELVSDNDSLRLSGGRHALNMENRENDAATRLNDRLVLQPEISMNSSHLNKDLEGKPHLPERNTESADTEERRLSRCVQASLTGTCRPSSSSLRSEVERLSRALSQSSFEITSILRPQNNQTYENSTASFSTDVNAPSVSALETEPQLKKTDNSVLLNTSMEITVSNAAEIITVETKPKKKGHSCKPKGTKGQQGACGSSAGVQNGLNGRPKKGPAETPTHMIEQPPEDKDPGVLQLQLPKTLSKNVKTSRIPKLDHHQKAPKSTTDPCDTELQEADDYFSDRKDISLKAGDSEPKEGSASSKITYRRSKTKVKRRSAIIHKVPSASALLPLDDESQQSRLEKVHNEEKAENREPHPPHDPILYPEEVASSELELVENQPPEVWRKTENKPRCRSTFVISVFRDSKSPVLDHDLILPAEPHSEAEEKLKYVAGKKTSHSDPLTETRNSLKRPLVESSEHNREVLPVDQHDPSGLEHHKHKKSKREDAGGSRKKKMSLEKCAGGSDTRQKKKTKNNREVSSKNEASLHFACREEPPSCSTYGPEVRREGEDAFQMVHSRDSHDISEALRSPNESKAKDDPKPHRKTKLHTATESRNPRETFVYHRRTTWDKTKNISLNNSGMSIASDETVHQHVGVLLKDELPPWLFGGLSTVDTEANSLPSSPTRSTSSRYAVTEESTKASPAGRVLTMVTNTFTSPDSENERRNRRRNCVVSYKEPPLNSGATCSLGSTQYLNRLEREAMILSSFAGIIMSNLPVEEIFTLYRCKPAASYPSHQSKGSIVLPFTLSYHPFAMLRSYKAVQHSKKLNQKLKRWLSKQTKASAPQRPVSARSSSPSLSESFGSESSYSHQKAAENYEGSQESLQD
ncbi:uncharacterized protein sgo2 isoform X2 [Girardinichthys multiradiatus]|uniref:uncharacterized protein sgo2 isoform X2 n=1 Tax=Girardinichthys multiradiatus TaxID=208333 RepID=UPI001FAC142B|nr:uncharacterized protein sgo2 isoform X2 [Girardinichthys multiradiatus]